MHYRNFFKLRHDSIWGSRRGAVAVLFALTLVPLIIGASMATDFARMSILKSSLQTIADSAALAGASELNQNSDEPTSAANAMLIAKTYFNKGFAALTDSGSTPGPTVAVPDSTTVTVTATATISMTLMSLFNAATQSVTVSSKARGPGYALKFVPGKGLTSSSAYDENDIYYYTVPASGSGRPPIDATGSAYKLLFSNNYMKYPNLNSSVTIAVGKNDLVGFGMYNITGGITSTGTNVYGGVDNSVHAFYSSIAAPSMDAGQTADVLKLKGYPTQQPIYTASDAMNKCVKTNINLTTTAHVSKDADPCKLGGYPCVTKAKRADGTTGLFQNNLAVNSQCSNSTNAILSCLQLYDTPTTFSWGDMGGKPDDFDNDDLDYTVQCVPNTTGTSSSGQPPGVILVQ